MIPFNINDHVLVQLTPHGRKLHRARHNELAARFPDVEVLQNYDLEEDAEGWSRWQLWELMHVFGNDCFNGCIPPFQMTIKFEIVKAEFPKPIVKVMEASA